MLTRKEYMANSANLHRTYYAQFVTPAIRADVLRQFGREQLVKAFALDPAFNTLALERWDAIARYRCNEMHTQMKEAGDFWSLSNGVCIAKEAARQIIETK